MDTIVSRQGNTVLLTIPANSQIAVWTQGKGYVNQTAQSATVPVVPQSLLATVSAGVPYLSGVLSATLPTYIQIESAGESPVFYNIGVSPLSFAAVDAVYQPVPGTLNASGALTIALMSTRIITSSAGTVMTVDTGAVMDAAAVWAIGDSIDWSVINTGAVTFTVTAATNHTLVGTMGVTTGTSGLFRTKKTAAATFVTYRIS
jgi:hypothetical protein